jgi:hypothetical protein
MGPQMHLPSPSTLAQGAKKKSENTRTIFGYLLLGNIKSPKWPPKYDFFTLPVQSTKIFS